MEPDEKPIVVVKAPLAKIIRNPNHLTIYQDRVNRVNRLVTTAYLFSRYIFVHSYDDNDAFNADITKFKFPRISATCLHFSPELAGRYRLRRANHN